MNTGSLVFGKFFAKAVGAVLRLQKTRDILGEKAVLTEGLGQR